MDTLTHGRSMSSDISEWALTLTLSPYQHVTDLSRIPEPEINEKNSSVMINIWYQLDWIRASLDSWKSIISGCTCSGISGRDWHLSHWTEMGRICPHHLRWHHPNS
jgi:hypothetical protein